MFCYIEQMLVPVLGGVVALLLIGAWVFKTVARKPVRRAELEQFARVHHVAITPANGDRLIHYLAVTGRWQSTGMVCGMLGSIGWTVARGSLGLNSLVLFAGWFAGALVAEIRLAFPPVGSRRVASLTPRLPGDYLSRFAWWLLPALALASVGASATIAVVAARGGPVSAGAVGVAAGVAAIGIAVLTRLVQLRVLRRSQPVAGPDMLAMDYAIRSRSLYILAGVGAALVLYCVLVQLGALASALPGDWRSDLDRAIKIGFVAVPLLGFLMSTARWGVRPAAPSPASGAA
jgi:hypothetical protein